MKKLLLTISLIALSTTAFSTTAQAYDKNNVVIGLGASDVFDGDNTDPMGNIEWRGASMQRTSTFGIPNVSPMAGLSLTTEGAGMVYGGLLYDWNVASQWSIVPSLSLGAYWDGDGKDMGGIFQIRPAIEVNYKLDARQSVGVNLAHISNLGIYDKNPGKEDLTLNYSIAY